MPILQVLNVGQGDSMILRPGRFCAFEKEALMIDLGPGGYDITKHIGDGEDIQIVLSHHDADHFGGFKFFAGRMDRIRRIIVPLHQNEITLIAKSILNLKGMRGARDCGEFIRLLEEIVGNQLLLKDCCERPSGQPVLSFAYDGKRLCGHIACLNPPILPGTYDWLREMDAGGLSGILEELFEPAFAEIMEQYAAVSRSGRDRRYVDSPEIERIFLNGRLSDEDIGPRNDIQRSKANFVFGFIMENLRLLREFNSAPVRRNLRKVCQSYGRCAHDVCAVLRAEYPEGTFLFTGDASKKVFYRLMGEGRDLRADYLKIPHHGSKENLDEGILRAIRPGTAIISHRNGCFGRAKDPHPNRGVLALLQKYHVRILLTNDVFKDGAVYMRKAAHRTDAHVEIL